MRTFRTVMTIALGVAIAALLMFETSHYLALGLQTIEDWVPGHVTGDALSALGVWSLVAWAAILASYLLVGLLVAGVVMALIDEAAALLAGSRSEGHRHRHQRF